MYTIDFDERTRILHTKVEGFWTLATVVAFSTKVLAFGAAMKIRHGEFAVLNDVRLFPVQSPQVVKAIDFLQAKGMTISTAPSATVVGSHLSKMQAERTLTGSHMRVFLDWDEAVAWLDEVWISKRALAA